MHEKKKKLNKTNRDYTVGPMRLFPVSIVIVQKTLVHVSAMCEQSEREREQMAERQREREIERERERETESQRERERESETDRQRNRELCFHLFDSFTTSL